MNSPGRVAHSFSVIQVQLRRDSNIRAHLGKIKVWNASGVRPRACDTVQSIATFSGCREPEWKGSDLPKDQQGTRRSLACGSAFATFFGSLQRRWWGRGGCFFLVVFKGREKGGGEGKSVGLGQGFRV